MMRESFLPRLSYGYDGYERKRREKRAKICSLTEPPSWCTICIQMFEPVGIQWTCPCLHAAPDWLRLTVFSWGMTRIYCETALRATINSSVNSKRAYLMEISNVSNSLNQFGTKTNSLCRSLLCTENETFRRKLWFVPFVVHFNFARRPKKVIIRKWRRQWKRTPSKEKKPRKTHRKFGNFKLKLFGRQMLVDHELFDFSIPRCAT